VTRAAADESGLGSAVGRAQRRVIVNQACGEVGTALSVALLGPTLFLVLGREWFSWPLAAFFIAAGIAAAGLRLRKRRPSLYNVAQVLDARLATADQISTAIFFLDSAEPVALAQRRRAAAIASKIDPDAVFPLTLPRSLYAVASVFLVASTLFALRYLLEKPFSLQKPLPRVIAQVLQDEKVANAEKGPAVPKNRKHSSKEESQDSEAENPDQPEREAPEQAKDTSSPQAPGAIPGVPKNDPQSDQQQGAQDQQEKPDSSAGMGGDPMQTADNYPVQSYDEMMAKDAKAGGSDKQDSNGKSGNDPGDKGSSGEQDPSSNSLLSKLKEAMSNMLSRLQQKPGDGSAGKQQQAQQGSQSPGDQQKEGQGGEAQSADGQPKAGAAEGSEGQAVESDAKDASGQKAGSKSNASTSDKGSHSGSSGAGREDGEKNILEAQQQEAMGKLSELYGQRAKALTGEVTVEAQSGKQTLRTPQSAKVAGHSDSGGEVSRDEIPLAYQVFVKEYFNRLRESKK